MFWVMIDVIPLLIAAFASLLLLVNPVTLVMPRTTPMMSRRRYPRESFTSDTRANRPQMTGWSVGAEAEEAGEEGGASDSRGLARKGCAGFSEGRVGRAVVWRWRARAIA